MPQHHDEMAVLTPDGYKKLNELVEHLKSEHREELRERMKNSEKSSVLSEDSEYDEIKKEQTLLESRISYLENILKKSRVLSPSEISTDKVGIGSRVKIRNLKNKEEEEYTVLSTMEANPAEGKISDVCPVGRALMRAKKGDIVVSETPNGNTRYLVLSIKKH